MKFKIYGYGIGLNSKGNLRDLNSDKLISNHLNWIESNPSLLNFLEFNPIPYPYILNFKWIEVHWSKLKTNQLRLDEFKLIQGNLIDINSTQFEFIKAYWIKFKSSALYYKFKSPIK